MAGRILHTEESMMLHKACPFGTLISQMNRIYYTWPVRRFHRMRRKRIRLCVFTPWWVVPNDMLGLTDESTELDSFYIVNVGHRKKQGQKNFKSGEPCVHCACMWTQNANIRIQAKAECHVLIIQSLEIYEHTSFVLSFDWNPVLRLPTFPPPNPCQRAFKCAKKKALSIRKRI